MHRHYPLLLIILLASCTPQRARDVERVDLLRSQAENLINAQSHMGWNNWVFGRPSNQDSLYQANAGIFSLENINLVKSLEETEVDSVQKRRFRYFRRYLATELIAKSVAAITDSIANLEANITVRFDGRDVPYRQTSTLMAREQSQTRRSALYAAIDPILDSINTLHRTVEESNQRFSATLGYPSFTAMVSDLKEIDLAAFRQTCERVLTETEKTYTTLLQEQLSHTLGVKPERFYRYDTPRLFRSEQFDRYFPADSMLPLMQRTFAGMNIHPLSMRNLRIDAEPYENKNPRAVCFPIDVPGDIRLSIKPIGGADDYSALFHELGHGLHYAGTREHALEFKYLGEPTVTETFAFLSEFLLTNQAWLRTHTRMPVKDLKEFVRQQAFRRLYYVRRYCGKFLYELYLHEGNAEPDQEYARILSSATGYQPIPSDAKRYLTDLDPLYYSAGYLRAWFLESMLTEVLVFRFGTNWYEVPDAGEFLGNLWAKGDRFNGDDLAVQLGYQEITPDPLIEAVGSMLHFATR
jgi:hypothetical protein